MKKIGFVGVGIMGKSMVRNLMKAGYELHIYARTKAKVEDVIAEGAMFHETVGDCAANVDAMISIVGYPKDVEKVYFGENGILDSAKEGTYVIDMTTSSPNLAKRIYEAAKEKGLHAMDAPVTGGDTGAKNGTLSILVGGDREDYEACHKIFEAMGTNINYEGGPGCGQHTKMANQIMIAGTMTGMTEMLVYAKATGLELEKVLETLSGGAAANWSMSNYSPRILQNDFSPGFFVKHFIKDLKIALDEAEKQQIALPGTALAKELYEKLANEGYENDGTQALIKLWWK